MTLELLYMQYPCAITVTQYSEILRPIKTHFFLPTSDLQADRPEKIQYITMEKLLTGCITMHKDVPGVAVHKLLYLGHHQS